MINAPTFRQMQYLLALHKAQNFGQAAKDCFITQPTLSQAIIEMESILGATVLDRSQRKKVAFTAFGLEVVATAKGLLPELENLMEKARATNEPLSGVMRLGVIPTIAPYLLPKILPQLHQNFSKMEFQIAEDMSHKLIAKLEDNEIDIALMALPYEVKDFQSCTLFNEAFVCAAPKGIFAKGQKVSVKDLDNQNLLLLQDGHCLRDHILSACKRADEASAQPFKATSLQTLIQMVGQGFGLTLLPEMVMAQGGLPKGVTTHSFKSPAPSRQIGLVWRGNSYKRDNIDAVIKHLKNVT